MEPPYVYQALTAPTSIRLLRLLPNADLNAPLQGQLFECNIEEFYGQPNSYEALSYVWGVPEPGYSISLNGSRLPVTPNLYGALTHLRHRYREQLWWVDAICINQTDDREKERQIGLMYQIYACASCVIVWLGDGLLGETEDGSQHVFDELLIARQQMVDDPKRHSLVSEKIVELFQRAWFRRIWVLQEVGAARRIRIHDGGSVMDGYAFSEVLDLFRASLKSRPEWQNLLNVAQSASYLMKQSVFRRLYQGPGESSEGIFHFRQLIDMFHDREATKAQDKVFALLGMTSEDMSMSGLLPDYTIDFAQLFKRLVKFMISDRVAVECQGDEEVAVVHCTGYVVAKIQDATHDPRSAHATMITLNWVNEESKAFSDEDSKAFSDEDSKTFSDNEDSEYFSGDEDYKNLSHISLPIGELSGNYEEPESYWDMWSIQATAAPLRKGDLVCILDGAAHPTIIRVFQDYSVVLVAAVWIEKRKDKSESDQRLWCKKLVEERHSLKRDFTLVWDWKYSFESDTFLDTFAAWAESRSWGLEDPASSTEKDLDDLSRRCDCALICIDGQGIRQSRDRLKELLSDFEHMLQSREFRAVRETSFSAFLSRISSRYDTMPRPQAMVSEDPRLSDVVEQNELQYIAALCYWAAEEHYENATELLIKTNKVDATFDARYSIHSILAKLAGDGFVDLVELALAHGADANSKDGGMKALQLAAEKGHLAVVERLLQVISDVNAPVSYGGRTALQAAAEQGHLAIVKRLIQANADVNALTSYRDRTALQEAAERGHIAIVEQLLQANADVNAQADDDSITALQAAAEQGHLAIVKRLIQANADVNALTSYRGRTALQAAAEQGHLAIVKRLIQANADVNALKSNGGRTALQAAAGEGHLAIVKRLIQANADVNASALYRGSTALQAAAQGGHIAIVELLLQHKAEVDSSVDRYGDTTGLVAAARAGYLPVVERLLREKGRFRQKSMFRARDSALAAAAGAGHLPIVEMLLGAKADSGLPPEFYSREEQQLLDTALKHAASAGHIRIVERLLDAGAFVNDEGMLRHGITALTAAAGFGHMIVVERLLQAGADIEIKDQVAWKRLPMSQRPDRPRTWYKRLTAEQFARRRGHHAVAERLEKQRLWQQATIEPQEASCDSLSTKETTIGPN